MLRISQFLVDILVNWLLLIQWSSSSTLSPEPPHPIFKGEAYAHLEKASIHYPLCSTTDASCLKTFYEIKKIIWCEYLHFLCSIQACLMAVSCSPLTQFQMRCFQLGQKMQSLVKSTCCL